MIPETQSLLDQGCWTFFVLMFAHFLADYPLQGPFLSEAKNRNTAIGKTFWPHALTAHSFIHAGFVGLITGSLVMAVAEGVIHWITDFLRCENKISLHVDQLIHVSCKIIWTLIVLEHLQLFNQ